MTHLVEQLLTLARVDPSRPDIVPESLDPADVVADVCAEMLPHASRRAQSIHADVAPGCRIAAAPAWLQIALRNLIDNAVRYAGEGARIEVRLVREDRGCLLSVADDGPGVPRDRRAALSARFVRGEDTEGEGCGLGLSIVARIAALTHARLELDDGLPRVDGGHGFAARLVFRQETRPNEFGASTPGARPHA